ncbi:MAG: Stp1/IreP family PP2C-type Ser/Thr phosphatase [Lautropia sp.]
MSDPRLPRAASPAPSASTGPSTRTQGDAQASTPEAAAGAGRGGSAAPIVQYAALSDIGSERPHNEDRWQVAPDSGLLVVADGMGGYRAGEVAAELAVQTVCQLVQDLLALGMEPGEALARAIAAANDEIRDFAMANPECLGMGTTVICAIVAERRVHLAHVGDSRAYLLRDARLSRLTRDHSIGQQIVDAGRLSEHEVREFAARGILTRALGVEDAVQADAQTLDWREGDTLLLCSDGLTDPVDDTAIEALLLAQADAGPGAQARALIGGALQAGGADNITAVVARAGLPARMPGTGGASGKRAH